MIAVLLGLACEATDPAELSDTSAGDTSEVADTALGDPIAAWDYFPLDGQRAWEYLLDDGSDTEREVELLQPTTTSGDHEVAELRHHEPAGGGDVLTVSWSSSEALGVFVHGYTVVATQEEVTFDSPIQVAEPEMREGQTVASSSNGQDYRSTFASVEGCANHWVGDDWDACARLNVEGPGPFAGSYWLVPRYGVAWMQLRDDPAVWVLKRAEWAPNDD